MVRHAFSGKAPKKAAPNSIYEVIGGNGKVSSRAFYDDNGYQFARQDFGHTHGGLKPHEHGMGYDAQGRPNKVKTSGPVPPGYDDTPTPM
jgi:hypothetical protein